MTDIVWADAIDQRDTQIATLTSEIRRLHSEKEEIIETRSTEADALRSALIIISDERDGFLRERDAYRSMIRDMMASACPNERDHPTMFRCWERAHELLKKGPT